MIRNDYRRALVMLRSLRNGYSGHARIEIRVLTGSLNLRAAIPQNAGEAHVALVGRRRTEYFAWPLGTLRRDMRGQAGLSVNFDPRDVGGRTLDAYSLLTVAQTDPDGCDLVLVGNLEGSCEMDWPGVREAVCALYRADSVASLPDPAEEIPETAPEPIAEELPITASDVIAEELPITASDVIAEDTRQAENAAEETVPEEELPEAEQPEPELPAPEEAPSGACEACRIIAEELEKEELPEEDCYAREGWQFTKIALPAGCAYEYACVGYPEGKDAPGSAAVALPAFYTPEPPPGLEEYHWEGGFGWGWWVWIRQM